jgi:hypothetical protein
MGCMPRTARRVRAAIVDAESVRHHMRTAVHTGRRKTRWWLAGALPVLVAASGCNPAVLGVTIAAAGGGGSSSREPAALPAVDATLALATEIRGPGQSFQAALTLVGDRPRQAEFELDVDDADELGTPIPLVASVTSFPGGGRFTVDLSATSSLPTDSYRLRARVRGAGERTTVVEAPARLTVTACLPLDPVAWATHASAAGATAELELTGAARMPFAPSAPSDLAVCGWWSGDLTLPGIADVVRAQGPAGMFVGIVDDGAEDPALGGRLLASVSIGSEGDTVRALGVTVLANGALVVCGTFQGVGCLFGRDNANAAVARSSTSVGGVPDVDAFVARYARVGSDPELRVEWLTVFPGAGTAVLNAIDVVEGSSPLVVGFGGTFAGTAQFGAVSLAAVGASDGCVGAVRADDGSPVWVRALGGSTAAGEGVTSVSGGSVTVGGVTTHRLGVAAVVAGEAQVRDGAGPIGPPLVATDGSPDIALLSFDADDGDRRFALRCGGTGADRPNRVLQAPGSGTLYVVGAVEGDAAFASVAGPAVTSSAVPGFTQAEGFVAKYDQSGNLRWAHRVFCTAGGTLNDVALFRDDPLGTGSLVGVVGDFRGSCTVGDEPSIGQDGRPSPASAGLRAVRRQDAFVARFTVGGGELSGVRHLGGTEDDSGIAIVALDDLSFYALGRFAASLVVPPALSLVAGGAGQKGIFFTRTQH